MTLNFLTPQQFHIHSISIQYPQENISENKFGFVLPDNSQPHEFPKLRYIFKVKYKNIRNEFKEIPHNCEINLDDLPPNIIDSINIINEFLNNRCYQETGISIV